MNEYVVVHQLGLGIPILGVIKGKSGADALNKCLPDHMVGIVKRSSQREINNNEVSFVLKKRDASKRWGPRICYTYHKPVIIEESR